jgi:hypothetical protein
LHKIIIFQLIVNIILSQIYTSSHKQKTPQTFKKTSS